jgi:hypothetical protein
VPSGATIVYEPRQKPEASGKRARDYTVASQVHELVGVASG